MSSIEHLITPQHVYSNIVEHLRSQMNVASLDSNDLKNLTIEKVVVSNFTTAFHFSIDVERTFKATSSVIALPTSGTPAVDKVVNEKIVGVLEETLEPGANHPIFNFNAWVHKPE